MNSKTAVAAAAAAGLLQRSQPLALLVPAVSDSGQMVAVVAAEQQCGNHKLDQVFLK